MQGIAVAVATTTDSTPPRVDELLHSPFKRLGGGRNVLGEVNVTTMLEKFMDGVERRLLIFNFTQDIAQDDPIKGSEGCWIRCCIVLDRQVGNSNLVVFESSFLRLLPNKWMHRTDWFQGDHMSGLSAEK